MRIIGRACILTKSWRGMSDLVPFIHSQQIKAKLNGKYVGDGTTMHGEAFAIVAIFLSKIKYSIATALYFW